MTYTKSLRFSKSKTCFLANNFQKHCKDFFTLNEAFSHFLRHIYIACFFLVYTKKNYYFYVITNLCFLFDCSVKIYERNVIAGLNFTTSGIYWTLKFLCITSTFEVIDFHIFRKSMTSFSKIDNMHSRLYIHELWNVKWVLK